MLLNCSQYSLIIYGNHFNKTSTNNTKSNKDITSKVFLKLILVAKAVEIKQAKIPKLMHNAVLNSNLGQSEKEFLALEQTVSHKQQLTYLEAARLPKNRVTARVGM